MSQETRSPIDVAGEYWATYNPKPKGMIFNEEELKGLDLRQLIKPGDIMWHNPEHDLVRLASDAHLDPWCNGRYALAALAWGLVALVVLGVGAGP